MTPKIIKKVNMFNLPTDESTTLRNPEPKPKRVSSPPEAKVINYFKLKNSGTSAKEKNQGQNHIKIKDEQDTQRKYASVSVATNSKKTNTVQSLKTSTINGSRISHM